MSTLNQLRQGLGRAWESLSEGWSHLSERAGQALTRFNPTRHGGDLQSAGEMVEHHASRWGLLAADVREDADSVIVRLEAPGMEAENFDIDVVDDYLVVRGEKRVQREDTSGRFHVMECAYGSFERAIPLPAAVEGGQARAKYRHGVLTVTLPKQAMARPRRIEVRAG